MGLRSKTHAEKFTKKENSIEPQAALRYHRWRIFEFSVQDFQGVFHLQEEVGIEEAIDVSNKKLILFKIYNVYLCIYYFYFYISISGIIRQTLTFSLHLRCTLKPRQEITEYYNRAAARSEKNRIKCSWNLLKSISGSTDNSKGASTL